MSVLKNLQSHLGRPGRFPFQHSTQSNFEVSHPLVLYGTDRSISTRDAFLMLPILVVETIEKRVAWIKSTKNNNTGHRVFMNWMRSNTIFVHVNLRSSLFTTYLVEGNEHHIKIHSKHSDKL